MGVDAVRSLLASHGLAGAYREFDVSSATVDLAAQAIGCEPGRIAKSLSLMVRDAPAVLVVMGTARLDNRKFKDVFQAKPRFIKPEELEGLVGYAAGGVCPFALPEGVPVYLDASLKRYDPVYPAAGAANNAVRLSLAELELLSRGTWVDVCREDAE